MKETFDLIKSVLDAGKSVVDNLFTKKLTKEDVEAIIAKHHVNQPSIREKFFVVISENQELVYNEKGELYIKNNNTDKMYLQQLFLQMLLKQMENQKEVEWEDAEIVEDTKLIEPPQDTKLNELELIKKIREKHKSLYGE